MKLQKRKCCPDRINRCLLICSVAVLMARLLLGVSGHAQVNVLTQHNDVARTGANLNETVLTPSNVNIKQFGMLFKRVVDDQVYSQPLYVANLKIAGGMHGVVYITTVNNSVYAFDANDPDATAPLWHVNFGTPASVFDGKFGCTDINGNMGIIGSPVIDIKSRTLYVVALTRLGDGFVQRLHALDLATGVDLPGSPVTITAPDFDPLMQNQRPALLLTSGKIYVGYASHCDKEPYHGFLISYDAKSLEQSEVLNTSPAGEKASIWQSGQAPAVDPDGNIYFVTGNGSWDGKVNFGESFVKVDPNLKVLDWFTPTNHAYLDATDTDLDSSGAMLVPGTKLVMDGGKQGVLYLVDQDHMGHLGDEHALQHFQVTSSHLHSIVYWNSAKSGSLIYMWGQRDHMRSYKLDGDKLDETPFQIRSEQNQGHPGAMISLSANGNKDGIVWAAIHATGDSWHESRPGILHAFDADNILHEIWNSLEDPERDDCNNYSKMAPPTIANGKVYLASFGTQNTGSGQLCVYGLLPNGAPPSPPTNVSTASGDAQISLTWAASAAAMTYVVKRSTGDENSFNPIVGGLTSPDYTDVTADNGVTYSYEVIAVNSNGGSSPSKKITVALSKPKHPTHVAH
jgi:hypothetical protein